MEEACHQFQRAVRPFSGAKGNCFTLGRVECFPYSHSPFTRFAGAVVQKVYADTNCVLNDDAHREWLVRRRTSLLRLRRQLSAQEREQICSKLPISGGPQAFWYMGIA